MGDDVFYRMADSFGPSSAWFFAWDRLQSVASKVPLTFRHLHHFTPAEDRAIAAFEREEIKRKAADHD